MDFNEVFSRVRLLIKNLARASLNGNDFIKFKRFYMNFNEVNLTFKFEIKHVGITD